MTHVSTLALHQYRLDELAPDARAAVDAHLSACDRCRRRLGAQEAARAAFAAEPIPPEIARLAPPANGPFARLVGGALPLLTLAAALLLAVVSGAPDPGVRTKGALPDVELWRGTAEGPRPVRADEALGAGDVVQVLYDTNGARHAVLAGRDASGRVEIYGELPPSDVLVPAPFGVTLDAARGVQEFFVVTSDAPLDVATVDAALASGRSGVQVRSVRVQKR